MPATAPDQTAQTPKFQAPKKKRKWPKRAAIALALILVAALAGSALRGGGQRAVSDAYLPARATRQRLTVTVTGTGTVQPNDTFRATTVLRGEVLTSPFEEGDVIAKDQVLYTLDAGDAEDRVKQATIALEQAKNGVERAKAGVDQAALGVTQAEGGVTQAGHGVSQAQAGAAQAQNGVDRAQAGVDQAALGITQAQAGVDRSQLSIAQAEAGVTQAKLAVDNAQLNYDALLRQQADNALDRQVKANGTGTVTKVYVDPGDQVAVGTPIADILDRDHMKLVAPFHAVAAKTFALGQSAAVTVGGTSQTLSGTITDMDTVDSVGPGGTRIRNVTILVDNPGTLSPSSTGTAMVGDSSSAASGTFAYRERTQLLSTYTGKLIRLDLREGDQVRENQVVGEFEEKSFQDQIDAAAIALENAKVSARNAQSTLDSAKLGLNDALLAVDNATLSQTSAQAALRDAQTAGGTAQISLEDAQLAQSNAQTSLANAQLSKETARIALSDAQLAQRSAEDNLQTALDNLKDYTITSPISGTIVEKHIEAGEDVDPTAPYMALVYDLSRLTFDVNVSELDISRVEVGQSVTFTADALDGVTFTGRVDRVHINGSTVNGVTNYPVTVAVDGGEGLYPGMNVSATILVEDVGSVLTLPVDAIQRPNFVYIAADGALNANGELINPDKLEKREVTVGRNDSENIEILSGISEGETVFIPNSSTSAMQTMVQMMGR